MTKKPSKKIVIRPAKSSEPVRMFRDEPVHAPKSPYWTIVGLREDDGWYELYQAKNEQEGKRFLALALDDESGSMEKWDDVGLYPPQIEVKHPRPEPMSAMPSARRRATATKTTVRRKK